MTPDREAEEQAKRLAAKVEDCRDRPEHTAKEFIELEDHAQWLRNAIYRLKDRITQLKTNQGAES